MADRSSRGARRSSPATRSRRPRASRTSPNGTAAATTCSSPSRATSVARRSAAGPGRTSCEECELMAELEPGAQIPQLRITPDKYLTVRYAGASGDFNPIHIDEELARAVGLPGRILHGLWTMAQVARAQTEAAGGPEHLKRLSVQFRGMGVPEQEVVVSGTVRESSGERVLVDTVAEQAGNQIIRNAEAELEL